VVVTDGSIRGGMAELQFGGAQILRNAIGEPAVRCIRAARRHAEPVDGGVSGFESNISRIVFSLVRSEDVGARRARKWRRRWRPGGDREFRPGEPGVEAEPGIISSRNTLYRIRRKREVPGDSSGRFDHGDVFEGRIRPAAFRVLK